MAKRNPREAGQRKCATPKVDLSRQSAQVISRVFVRRRNAISSLPLPAPKKKCSPDSISSDGESSSDELLSSETNDAVHRCGLNSDSDDYSKYIADNGDENSSNGFKITDTPINTPLVQDKEILLKLEQELTSHLLQDKIKELREKYTSFRRVRGDGNCFLRAFKFAYLEHILLMNDKEEASRFLAKIEESKNKILLDNMRPLETLMSDYDALCNIVTLVSSRAGNRISHTVLLEWSNIEDGYSDPAIRFLRMVTSNEIRKRPNHFEQSIQGLFCDTTMTVQKFCEIEVEPMGKEVDNVQITAFVDALGVPIRIEYVHDSKHKLNHYDFGIEASPLEEPYITLLYRPGHYDILYTKDYHMLVPEPVEVVLKDSEIPEKEPKIIAKDPATSQMDPIEKDEDLHMTLLTYVRRKRKGLDKGL